MTELKNELLEIRGALNYAYLDNKIKKELYDNLINRTEKALDLCVVVGRSEQLSCGRNITTCVFYKGGKCSNLEYCRDQTT
jgi:hypothetical protein